MPAQAHIVKRLTVERVIECTGAGYVVTMVWEYCTNPNGLIWCRHRAAAHHFRTEHEAALVASTRDAITQEITPRRPHDKAQPS